ncbi:hypothetical protein BK022_13520 [Methylorubrum extorquens]|uniref:Uncharacterized protein n=1 Tax=Methylorubrum extorquens TaxID=408 RepID=A0A1S1P3J0_METEX|nr:hypothetical protein BK022_13520 [Methylorubrum extorquens]
MPLDMAGELLGFLVSGIDRHWRVDCDAPIALAALPLEAGPTLFECDPGWALDADSLEAAVRR